MERGGLQVEAPPRGGDLFPTGGQAGLLLQRRADGDQWLVDLVQQLVCRGHRLRLRIERRGIRAGGHPQGRGPGLPRRQNKGRHRNASKPPESAHGGTSCPRGPLPTACG